jgi:hypothetical protein
MGFQRGNAGSGRLSKTLYAYGYEEGEDGKSNSQKKPQTTDL